MNPSASHHESHGNGDSTKREHELAMAELRIRQETEKAEREHKKEEDKFNREMERLERQNMTRHDRDLAMTNALTNSALQVLGVVFDKAMAMQDQVLKAEKMLLEAQTADHKAEREFIAELARTNPELARDYIMLSAQRR